MSQRGQRYWTDSWNWTEVISHAFISFHFLLLQYTTDPKHYLCLAGDCSPAQSPVLRLFGTSFHTDHRHNGTPAERKFQDLCRLKSCIVLGRGNRSYQGFDWSCFLSSFWIGQLRVLTHMHCLASSVQTLGLVLLWKMQTQKLSKERRSRQLTWFKPLLSKYWCLISVIIQNILPQICAVRNWKQISQFQSDLHSKNVP